MLIRAPHYFRIILSPSLLIYSAITKYYDALAELLSGLYVFAHKPQIKTIAIGRGRRTASYYGYGRRKEMATNKIYRLKKEETNKYQWWQKKGSTHQTWPHQRGPTPIPESPTVAFSPWKINVLKPNRRTDFTSSIVGQFCFFRK